MRFHLIDNLRDWQSVRECLDIFASGWVFRGQRDATWQLQSTIERATSRLPAHLAESLVHRAFTRNMHAYVPPNEAPTNPLEILALMQHHGAPTRLLDFTHSAYVACFFALEHAADANGSCAIWAIDEDWCKANAGRIVRAELGQKEPELKDFQIRASTIEPDHFHKICFQAELRLLVPVEPYRRHARLTIQQGVFLCPGNVNAGFAGNVAAYDNLEPEKHVAKIVIPNALRFEILRDLHYMNINRATLFPGIDGFAQSLYHSILWLEDHGQTTRTMQRRQAFGPPFTA